MNKHAFPRPYSEGPSVLEGAYSAQAGMTLRAYFAGQALVGFLSNGESEGDSDLARRCVEYADALIEALKRREEDS